MRWQRCLDSETKRSFTAFEVGVSLIQAFVFTILAAVYIGGALHPAH